MALLHRSNEGIARADRNDINLFQLRTGLADQVLSQKMRRGTKRIDADSMPFEVLRSGNAACSVGDDDGVLWRLGELDDRGHDLVLGLQVEGMVVIANH